MRLTFKNNTIKLTKVENFLILFVFLPSKGVVSPQSIRFPNTQNKSNNNEKNRKNASVENLEFLRFLVSNPNPIRPIINLT